MTFSHPPSDHERRLRPLGDVDAEGRIERVNVRHGRDQERCDAEEHEERQRLRVARPLPTHVCCRQCARPRDQRRHAAKQGAVEIGEALEELLAELEERVTTVARPLLAALCAIGRRQPLVATHAPLGYGRGNSGATGRGCGDGPLLGDPHATCYGGPVGAASGRRSASSSTMLCEVPKASVGQGRSTVTGVRRRLVAVGATPAHDGGGRRSPRCHSSAAAHPGSR
jgi:hypothetical protein